MHVRQASLDDLDQLVPLFDGYRQFYKKDSDEEGARSFLSERLENNESVVYIVFAKAEETQAVGFTQVYPLFSSVRMKRMLLLNDLYIDPNFRGKGVGTALIDTVKNLCRNLGQNGIALQTAYDNPAQRLYEREGFKKDTDLQYFWVLE
jgi:GNAT superfamily N-acetyltransferase